MPIAFSPQRWQTVRENARRWWKGELERPLIHMTVGGRKPGRPEPRLPGVSRDTTSYDLSVPPEDIVDRWDYNLSCIEYLGDAFPCVWPDFGPGVAAAFMGARPEPGMGTVWFHPEKVQEIGTSASSTTRPTCGSGGSRISAARPWIAGKARSRSR
jgi:hypothetical protein